MSRRSVKQRGMALIFLAITLFLVFAAAAFGVDIAYLYVQKNRLQNAADAAAIAGANTIYRSVEFSYTQFPTGRYPNPSTYPFFPNVDGSLTWTDVARNRVRESLSENQSLDFLASNADIAVNWYNTITGNANDPKIPAVRVYLLAPTSLFFAKAIGVSTLTLKAQATAVATFPRSVNSGLPMAAALCAVNRGWDFAAKEPIKAGSPPAARSFQFGTVSPEGGTLCADSKATGAWTTFTTGSVDASTVADFIPHDRNTAVRTFTLSTDSNQTVTYSNGEMASNYGYTQECLISKKCALAPIPVLNSDPNNGLPSGSGSSTVSAPLKGFICAKVTFVKTTTDNKYIQGEFSTGCRVPSSGTAGGNDFFGVIASPTFVD